MGLKIALIHITSGVDATPASPVIDHLGIEIISSSLLKAGHYPVQFDSLIQNLSLDYFHNCILSANPDVMAFSLNYVNWKDSLLIMERIKEENKSIVCVSGGYYATFHWYELLLNSACDYCVIGEAEVSMVALSNALDKHQDIETIPGLAFLHNGKAICNPPTRVTELLTLGRPDRQLMAEMEKFQVGCRKIALERSRGCYHACSFCSIASMQRLSGDLHRRRVRDMDDLVEEIKELKRESKIRDYWFMDATFLGSDSEKEQDILLAKKLADLNDGEMTIEIDTRADTINPEIIKYLKAAGLSKVFLGVESFDQGMLNLFGKGMTADRNRYAIDVLEDAGIDYILGTILFSPGKTIEQFRKEHNVLKIIGYEHTQLLFRLKMYIGTVVAKGKDCDGRGVSLGEDYGWEIEDPWMKALWELVDPCRLALLDIVFNDLTKYFYQSRISVKQFMNMMKTTYHKMGDSIEDALGALKGNCLPGKMQIIQYQESLLKDIEGYRKKLLKAQEC